MALPPTRPLKFHQEILDTFFKTVNITKNLEFEMRVVYGKEERFKKPLEALMLALLYLREAQTLTEANIRQEYPDLFNPGNQKPDSPP